ncbi:hypothetical protein HDU81_001458 [Chytriomyces hyalinus]|nr:hypothetical protein HDU81_001458 [Chytriomyces hyalinus]
MAEPIVLAAGMNYLADQHRDNVLDYFTSKVFAPDMTSQERCNYMQLIIAIRFLQGWWQEYGLNTFVPRWVDELDFQKPVGLLDCRHNGSGMNMYLQQQNNSEFPWITLNRGRCYRQWLEKFGTGFYQGITTQFSNIIQQQPRRRVRMYLLIPGTASSWKGQEESDLVGNDFVINVNLKGEFAQMFFGTKFVKAYKDFKKAKRSKK